MIQIQKKAVVFAPFWRQSGHVGINRVDRFVRWLAEDGYTVVIVRAGTANGAWSQAWGQEIVVRDPLGLYRDTPSPGIAHHVAAARKPNKLRRALAYWLFNPDPTVLWARAAAANALVLGATHDANFILSSSPPESAHVAAWLLSRRTGVPYIVDMRDGWLDEPLRRSLRTSAFRRWREGRLERRVLGDAKGIQVTSNTWQSLLNDRYPAFVPKVQVLTNGYPQSVRLPRSKSAKGPDEELLLIHAGRFSNSDTRRTIDLLLEPLFYVLSRQPSCGVIQLIGPLSSDELTVVDAVKSRYGTIGWRIECLGSMPRPELLSLLSKADGLLLLSASYAALPSKLFEYIPAGGPLLVVAERASAVWQLCQDLPQAVLVEMGKTDYADVDGRFLELLRAPNFCSHVPQEYYEERLARKFMRAVKQCL